MFNANSFNMAMLMSLNMATKTLYSEKSNIIINNQIILNTASLKFPDFTLTWHLTLTRQEKEGKNNLTYGKASQKSILKENVELASQLPRPDLGILSGQEVSSLKGTHFRGPVLKFRTVGGTTCH